MHKKSRIAQTLTAAGLALLLTAGTAFAATGSATVTANGLRMRSAANTSSSILTSANRGATVTLLSGEENGWYQVSYKGYEGYMSAQYLSVITAPTTETDTTTPAAASTSDTGTVNAGPLNVRSGAGTGYSRVGSLAKGASVTILDSSVSGWYKVTNGLLTGYVSAQYITLVTKSTASSSVADASNAAEVTPVVTEGPLNVRAGAGTEYERIGTLQTGDKVTVLDTSVSGWYQVTNGTITGYVSSQYISLDGVVPQRGLVTASSLNVRAGAGTGYNSLGTVRIGTTVSILDTVNGWYQVSANGLTGYVSAEYVVILDDLGSSPLGATAAALAVSLIGSRYVYGAEGPTTFDCSGLSYYIYGQLGRTIARGSSGQYNNSGSFVPLAEIEPGDLIFFFDPRFDGSGGTLPTTHMGIYVGNGQFVHASTTTYRVQYDNVYGSYYTRYIVGVKRIV